MTIKILSMRSRTWRFFLGWSQSIFVTITPKKKRQRPWSNMRCKFSPFQWDPPNWVCRIWSHISNSNFQNELFLEKTSFWSFRPTSSIFSENMVLNLFCPRMDILTAKNLKNHSVEKGVFVDFGKFLIKHEEKAQNFVNFEKSFKMCITNYGLRMKIFHFPSHYFNFFVLFFNSSTE